MEGSPKSSSFKGEHGGLFQIDLIDDVVTIDEKNVSGGCEIYYTSLPNAPPSDATSKQTKLILHLQVFKQHNSSEKQTVFTIHVQRLEAYGRWPDLGTAPPTIIVYLK